jgi:hypothetical protein
VELPVLDTRQPRRRGDVELQQRDRGDVPVS